MAQLAEGHPGLVELFEMKRPSLEGRTIYGLEIAADVDRRAGDGRPVYYLDGVHHAREWPASEYTIIFAHHLVENYGKDPRITDLLHRVRVIVVPIVNVDGFNYSRESVLSLTQPLRDATSLTGSGNGFEGCWRKNRRSLTGLTGQGTPRADQDLRDPAAARQPPRRGLGEGEGPHRAGHAPRRQLHLARDPSTRPYVGATGKTEAYSLQVTAAGRSRTLRIVVDRGERLDLRDDRAVKGGRLMETASSASGATRRRSCWPQRSCCRSRLRHARRTPAASTTTPPLLRYSCCQVPATC